MVKPSLKPTHAAAPTLPMPGSFAIERRLPLRQSQRSAPGMVYTYEVDDQKHKSKLLMVWSDARREVADAIWRHFECNAFGSWEWNDPRSAETLTLRWVAAPSISWSSPVTANVHGEFEIALAHS